MTIEKQVVSLELAMRLKELGVKQQSKFYWMEISGEWTIQFHTNNSVISALPREEWIKPAFSAFTVAELGEMLYSQPKYIGTNQEDGGKWRIQYDMQTWMIGDTEADARAKMLIYLLENKLITL